MISPEEKKKTLFEIIQEDGLKDIHYDLFGLPLPVSRHLVGLWVASLIVIVFFLLVARAQKRGGIQNPTKFVLLGELAVGFIRDQLIKPFLGNSSKFYFPYFATVFYVLLVSNFLGRIPLDWGAEVGGFSLGHYVSSPTTNFAFTTALTMVSFILAIAMGIKKHGAVKYWFSMVPGSVPAGLKPLIWFFEFISIFIRNIALTVRIFANMAGGHITVFVFLYFIVMFAGSADSGFFIKTTMPIISVAMGVALSFLEILVAFLQAYIFVLLSVIFIHLSGEKH